VKNWKERPCEETRTSLCHNEKHNPTTPTSGYNPATSTNSQVDVPLTSHQQSHLCFVRWRKKESIHNMKPAASSSTFATFYAVSSPPGRFNLGGPVPIRINRRSMRTWVDLDLPLRHKTWMLERMFET
jgi:hypothetical protein